MEYKIKPCTVVTSFKTYEECAEYIMKNKAKSDSQKNSSYPFERYFVKVLREHPVLFDEKHRKFRRGFQTKHAWSIVAGYMMMKRKAVQELWVTFQKFASSGIKLYVDLVNYVKLGEGIDWIDADSENEGDDSVKTEIEDNSSVKTEIEDNSSVKTEIEDNSSVIEGNGDHVKEEIVSPVKVDME